MNRKDMIIVAVLLNVVILSVLFVLAVNNEDPIVVDNTVNSQQIIVENKLPPKLNQAPVLLAVVDEGNDDDKLELILGDIDSPESEPAQRDQEWALFASRPTDVEPKVTEESGSENIVEIIVKKGDSLDRIARANATTVQSIRALNGLKNDHLKIGQVLNVDVGSAKKITDQRSTASVQPIAQRNIFTPPKEAVYYTVKSGDSPWKIAKQFNVNMDDLLKLNQLNEEKARNLKIGDRIRVQ